MCPSNHEMLRAKGFMSFEIFSSIIDQIADYEKGKEVYINLWGWGEPLLHGDIFGMVDYAANKKFRVRLSTNFNIDNPDIIRKLSGTQLDLLIVGLDGNSESVHQDYRVGGDFNLVVDNVSNFKHYVRSDNGNTKMAITTLLTPRLEKNLKDFIKFASNLDVDVLMLKYPNLWRFKKSKQEIEMLFNRFVKNLKHGSRYKIVSSGIESVSGRCSFLPINGVFLWNGDITTCCFDFDGDNVFGSINDLNFIDIFSNSWVQSRMKMKNHKYATCSKCDSSGPRIEVISFSPKVSSFLYGLT